MPGIINLDSSIWVAASEGRLDLVKQHIERGARPDEGDDSGYTPIHAAAAYGQKHVLKYLVLEASGDVNTTDNDGETALFGCESVDMAKCLVDECCADPFIRNRAGQTVSDHTSEIKPDLFLKQQAAQFILEEEDEFLDVAKYLASLTGEELYIEQDGTIHAH